MYDVIKKETAAEQIDNIADYIVSVFANVDAAIDLKTEQEVKENGNVLFEHDACS